MCSENSLKFGWLVSCHFIKGNVELRIENNLIKLDMYVALLTQVNMYCSLPTNTVGKIALKKLFNHNRVIDTRLI